MSQNPKRPDQDHWFEIVNQIGSDSSRELDDYFVGASAEPLESIDSILKEVEGSETVRAESTAESDQGADFADEMSGDSASFNDHSSQTREFPSGEDDSLTIDWGTPPKRAKSTQSASESKDVSEKSEKSRKSERPTRTEKPSRAPVQQKQLKSPPPASPKSSKVDSWDLLADDLGIEYPSQAQITIDEVSPTDSQSSFVQSDELHVDDAQPEPLMNQDLFEPQQVVDDPAQDVLSKMFAFGDPQESKSRSDRQQKTADKGSDKPVERVVSERDLPAEKRTDAEDEDELSDDFIEFDVESLTDENEQTQRRSQRRRGSRGDQNARPERESKPPEQSSRAEKPRRPESKSRGDSSRRPRNAPKDDYVDLPDDLPEVKPERKAGDGDGARKPRPESSQEAARKKKKIPAWSEAIGHIIETNLNARKKSNPSGKKRRRR
jgi:hypothetical protein